MIYKNNNLIMDDESVIGTIKDLEEYFKHELAYQCTSEDIGIENLIDNLKNTTDLLENLEEDKQIYNEFDLLKVSVHPMGGFVITSEEV